MHSSGLATIAISALVLSTVVAAQSRGEANYDEQCRRAAPQGTAAEQAATRQRCIEEARKAARTDQPGEGEQYQSSGARGAAAKTEREAARKERRAAGAQAARQPKQDPKRPDQQ